MSLEEMRALSVHNMKSRKGLNTYTNTSVRKYFFGKPHNQAGNTTEKGYSDCSSACRAAIQAASVINIGSIENDETLEDTLLSMVMRANALENKFNCYYYFAYGSNMDIEQMKHRCPSSVEAGVALVNGYRFALDAAGVATILFGKWFDAYQTDDIGMMQYLRRFKRPTRKSTASRMRFLREGIITTWTGRWRLLRKPATTS